MITIKFQEVGRDKKSWDKQFKQVDEEQISREAKRGAGLMSSGVDAEINDMGSAGIILVGGWRQVGTFLIISNLN
jgi:hypothetical protein